MFPAIPEATMIRVSKNLLISALFFYGSWAHAAADLVFVGGPIVTVNAKNEEVQALATKDGKIVAVGLEADIRKNWVDQKTQVIDLRGQTLMPGFVEPHVHI